jgi:hypothetical protein
MSVTSPRMMIAFLNLILLCTTVYLIVALQNTSGRFWETGTIWASCIPKTRR